MSPHDIGTRKIADWIKKHVRQCPACLQEETTFSTNLQMVLLPRAVILGRTEGTPDEPVLWKFQRTGREYAAVPVECENCGHVLFFSAGKLGIDNL